MPLHPRVTVITIFLNAERFLAEAIESVLAQRYRAWELVLANDGSTDGSEQIATRYARRHPAQVRYIAHAGQAHRGMSATRNLGIRAARGELIAFLDADDVWMPEKLAEQVALLEAHPTAAMLYGRTQLWFSWTGRPADRHKDTLTPLAVAPDTLVQPPLLLVRFLENEALYPCTCSMIVRREAFATIGAFEEAFRDAYEDMVFHTKLFLRAPVFVASAWWDRYRQHPDNSWQRALQAGLYDPLHPHPLRLKYLTWVEEYLTQQGVTDQDVWRALRKALEPYRPRP